MDSHSRIFVAGHRGLAGSAIVRTLRAAGHDNLLLPGRELLDLLTALGWKARTPLERGLADTLRWYRASRQVRL
jgi:nucleoside-diphosphate-sugar epimerase